MTNREVISKAFLDKDFSIYYTLYFKDLLPAVNSTSLFIQGWFDKEYEFDTIWLNLAFGVMGLKKAQFTYIYNDSAYKLSKIYYSPTFLRTGIIPSDYKFTAEELLSILLTKEV